MVIPLVVWVITRWYALNQVVLVLRVHSGMLHQDSHTIDYISLTVHDCGHPCTFQHDGLCQQNVDLRSLWKPQQSPSILSTCLTPISSDGNDGRTYDH